MSYSFDQIFAADPSNPERVASNGVVTIFAPGDESRTPLLITTVEGMAIQNPVQVNDSGHGPAFMHETLDRVAWEGGGFSGFFTSYEGMKQEAVAARVSAGEAAVAAVEAAANSVAPTAQAVEREIVTEGTPARTAVELVAEQAASTAAASKLDKTAAANMYAVKPDNGGKPVGKGEIVVNVQDYGAKGDGVADETAAVQAAVDALRARGGGTLHFPSGVYAMDGAVMLCSNLEITGQSATLQKRAGSDHYVFFIGSSGSKKGYGAGSSNIACHGITFKGSFKTGAKRPACAFSLHHSENILVYGCRFVEMAGRGHRFDLAGCRNVTVRDNIFEGFDTSYGTDLYNEDIQLDFSANGSLSHAEPSTLCYDGLPTRDVLVVGNIWRSITLDGVVYPAANPLGSHTCGENRFHENIYFIDNQILGGVVEDTASEVSGVLHFMCPRNLHIRGNIFENNGNATHAISIVPGVGGVPLEDIASPSGQWTRFATPQTAEDVIIEGNTFSGFYHANTSRDLINIRGHITGPVHAKRVSISGNHFRDNHRVVDNIGPNLIYAVYVESLLVSGNSSGRARRFILASTGRAIAVNNNTIRGARGFTINVTLSDGVSVQGNHISEGMVGWEIYITESTQGMVRGNTIVASPNPDPSIRLTASSRFVIDGNVLSAAPVGSGKGVEIIGASAQNIISQNVVLGYASAISALAGAALQANNITS